MVAVKDCPRCQPALGGGWHPTRETTVLVPTGKGKPHTVRVASTDSERDTFHAIRCLKDEATRAARKERQEAHASLVAQRLAVPPPPPPPDPLLDEGAQQVLRSELDYERQRLSEAQKEFAEHIDRVKDVKRAVVRPLACRPTACRRYTVTVTL